MSNAPASHRAPMRRPIASPKIRDGWRRIAENAYGDVDLGSGCGPFELALAHGVELAELPGAALRVTDDMIVYPHGMRRQQQSLLLYPALAEIFLMRAGDAATPEAIDCVANLLILPSGHNYSFDQDELERENPYVPVGVLDRILLERRISGPLPFAG